MYNWAGRFNILFVFLFIIGHSGILIAAEDKFKFTTTKWDEFTREVELQKEIDRRNGISYVISGSLALAGGIWGNSIATDAAEKGIYTVFQTIGIASLGYGSYVWQIGGEERSVYQTLQYSKLTAEQKTQFLQAYVLQKKEKERKDHIIRGITHGLIAGLNFYNASQQSNDSLKNTLNFIGGVNLLAAASFTFEF